MLRKLFDRLHPIFSDGGRLEKLYPLYEALDSFLYTPSDTTRHASHVRDAMNLKRMMGMVVVALLPCLYMALHNTGYQANLAISLGQGSAIEGWREAVLQWLGRGHDPESFLDCFTLGALYFFPVYFVTVAAGGFWEGLFAMVRKHELNEGFLVTSALLPLTLPPTIPLWQVAIGISFGVVIGKEIFGGIGKNFLNPALTARAFLYFAYAQNMSGASIWTAVDGFSGATPLGAIAEGSAGQSMQSLTNYSWWDCFVGYMQGSMGETSTLACLIGAVILIGTGIGSWRIMLGVVLGALATSGLFWAFSGETSSALVCMPPWWQLVTGGFAFGTVFMATDPVSAAMTETGRWWYGALVGVMTVLIRVINPAFPEGIMLAILFGNTMAPLIDYYVIQANIRRRMARYGTR